MSKPLDAVKFLLSETDPRKLGTCSAEVAFVGRSNVGKSTLLNAVCRKNIARVSKTPGCTRTINVFEAGRDRWLVDLPGYGFAAGPRAERYNLGAMVEGYFTGRSSLRMVFALVDAKVGPTKLDLQMLKWLEAVRLPWRIVATKADKVKVSRTIVQRRDVAHAMGLQPADLAWVSAKEGCSLNVLRDEVNALLGP